jgi:16S rRNA processing protein RimM
MQQALPMVVMGRVVGPFGLKGWLKVQVFTESPGGLLDHSSWWLGHNGKWDQRQVEESAEHGGVVVVKLVGCDEREVAAALKGWEVAVPRSALPATGEGEYYWSDLLGLRVTNVRSEELGRVRTLLETGANQVLVVDGERERLIPFVSAVVVSVDLARGELVVDWEADF